MNDRYLWDKTGPRDPEIAELETLLARYRDKPAARKRPHTRVWIASAALTAAAIALVFVALPRRSGWTLTTASNGSSAVRSGATVRTGSERVKLHDSNIGDIDLFPDSTLEIANRLSLRRGALHAFIWAPPARFTVDTPSARAIDLGCEYTLNVQADGAGLLRVSMGWVAFQRGAIESFIPAGAACRTDPKDGPGIPWFEDAPAELVTALNAGDTDRVLDQARPRDAITLWHLLQRTAPSSRKRIARRFAELVPGSDAGSLARGDRRALDAAWNRLGLGATDWWRTWKRNW